MVLIQLIVFCVVMLCTGVVGYQCFGGPCCLHHQGPHGNMVFGASMSLEKVLEKT